MLGPAHAADPPFQKVTMDAGVGYIVPEEFATAHKKELLKSLPGDITIDGFWTPTEQHTTVAERVFREALEQISKDGSVLLPDLAQSTNADDLAEMDRQKAEAGAILKNYKAYARQYIGIVVDGKQLVLCNYSDVKEIDPATEYMYLEKYFTSGEKTHFLFCRVEPHDKTWSNISIVGSWLPAEKE